MKLNKPRHPAFRQTCRLVHPRTDDVTCAPVYTRHHTQYLIHNPTKYSVRSDTYESVYLCFQMRADLSLRQSPFQYRVQLQGWYMYLEHSGYP
jgi:hypothetical protein